MRALHYSVAIKRKLSKKAKLSIFIFFYHGFADLLRHIRILSILRAHFGLIRCIHRQINARGRLAYRLVITGIYA